MMIAMRPLGLVLVVAEIASCTQRTPIVVLHAASLRRVMADAVPAFEKTHPEYTVQLSPSGSQVAARKVSELNARADLVMVADAEVIDRILIPGHAAFNLVFATNEIVLAYMQHSAQREIITADNWPGVLQGAGVRLGCVNPDLAPLGYHTVFTWMLAEKDTKLAPVSADLTAKLRARCDAQHPSADETELLGLLESRAVDYAFLYRSTAQDHRLQFVALPPELNLSRRELAATYDTVETQVQMKEKGTKSMVRGKPITYGVTIPTTAPNEQGAEALLQFLLSESGQAVQKAAGFQPLPKAACVNGCAQLPQNLTDAVAK